MKRKLYYVYWIRKTFDGNTVYELVTQVYAKTYKEAFKKSRNKIREWFEEFAPLVELKKQTFFIVKREEGKRFRYGAKN